MYTNMVIIFEARSTCMYKMRLWDLFRCTCTFKSVVLFVRDTIGLCKVLANTSTFNLQLPGFQKVFIIVAEQYLRQICFVFATVPVMVCVP